MKSYVTFSHHLHIIDGVVIDKNCAVCIDHTECGDGISAAFKMFDDKFAHCCNEHAFNANEAEKTLPNGIIHLSCKDFFNTRPFHEFDENTLLIDMGHFLSMVKSDTITDCDGIGLFATENEVSMISAIPSRIDKGYPTYNFTHIVWYSK